MFGFVIRLVTKIRLGSYDRGETKNHLDSLSLAFTLTYPPPMAQSLSLLEHSNSSKEWFSDGLPIFYNKIISSHPCKPLQVGRSTVDQVFYFSQSIADSFYQSKPGDLSDDLSKFQGSLLGHLFGPLSQTLSLEPLLLRLPSTNGWNGSLSGVYLLIFSNVSHLLLV